MKHFTWITLIVPAILFVPAESGQPKAFRLHGAIVDASTGAVLPARIYIQGADGAWHFPASTGGSAITYKKQRGDNPKCVEMHTTLSAYPFRIDLPAGKYTVTVERGKEYVPLVNGFERELVVHGNAPHQSAPSPSLVRNHAFA